MFKMIYIYVLKTTFSILLRHETIVTIFKGDIIIIPTILPDIKASAGEQTIVLFYYNSKVYAIDN